MSTKAKLDWTATDEVRKTGAIHRDLSEEEQLLQTTKDIEVRAYSARDRRLPRNLLEPLKSLWAKTRTLNPAFMKAVIGYQAA